MKYLLITAFCLSLGWAANAQSVDEGRKYIYYERFGTAANTLHKVLQQDPSNAEAWYWLSQTYNKEVTQKGIDSLDKAAAEVKNQPAFQVAYGHLLIQQNKNAEAMPYFEAALKATREKDAFILSAIANAHINSTSGDANYALELLNTAIKRDKKNPELYALKGNAYRKLKNGSAAFTAYREAIEKDENYAPAYQRLGEIFVTQKNAEQYLDYFNKAIAKDKDYAPAYYQLYMHYFYNDAAKAMAYFSQYANLSDKSLDNDYAHIDLLYLNKQYNDAITNATKMLNTEPDVQPRLYKLLAYSYQDLKDSAQALSYMQQYFAKEADSNMVMKDFETMGRMYTSISGKEDSAALFYQKAVALEKDPAAKFALYKRLSDLYKVSGNYSQHAYWLGNYYTNNPKATNVDLFNWGLAHYRGQEYTQADTVFGKYVAQYPEQGFGYYWQAKSNALIDTAMEKGLAVPHYAKLIEILEKDTTANETNKKWLVESYAYLAAYETNTEKDYKEAVDYFEKVLEVDPDNADAKKYIAILEKNINSQGGK